LDIQLARTFLEIIAAGSFGNAANRVHVTQSAITLRVQKLESLLGKQVFVRSKAGIVLTPAGEQFERYARTMVKAWEDAQYQVAAPAGYIDNLIVGSQYSLWPAFGFRWLRLLERQMPNVTLRAELGMPGALIDMMSDGLLDIGLMYTPQLRPGFNVELLFEDRLVLVSATRGYGPTLDGNYIFLDWGPEFAAVHAVRFPTFRVSHVTLSLGALAARYIIDRKKAAFLPARVAERYLNDGRLHVVENSPSFPYPAYAVWTAEKSPALLDEALQTLRGVAQKTETVQQDILDNAGIDELLDGRVRSDC
jgi:DNA-binding transcriptional LysR family regulator